MAAEPDDLALKLENYVLQLRQVEAALEIDPAHVELLKIKADLNELIDLTKSRLTARIKEGGPCSKKAKLSSECSTSPQEVVARPIDSSAESTAVGNIVSRLKTLKNESYRDFLFQALDESRPPEILKAIIKRYTNRGKKSIKRQCEEARGKAENDSESDETRHCNGSTEPSNGRATSRSAWNAPLIYRGDMIPANNGLLFMTVKSIRLKSNIYSGHKLVASVVCIVNSQKNLVFWSIVNWNKDEICDTFTDTTGVTPEALAIGFPLDQVSRLFQQVVKGNTIVGYNVQDNLQSLSVTHDRYDEDIADYFRDEKGAFSFEDLKYLLEKRDNEKGMNNDVISEARTLQVLYVWMKGKEVEYPTFSKCPMIKIIQDIRNKNAAVKPKVKQEPCGCDC